MGREKPGCDRQEKVAPSSRLALVLLSLTGPLFGNNVVLIIKVGKGINVSIFEILRMSGIRTERSHDMSFEYRDSLSVVEDWTRLLNSGGLEKLASIAKKISAAKEFADFEATALSRLHETGAELKEMKGRIKCFDRPAEDLADDAAILKKEAESVEPILKSAGELTIRHIITHCYEYIENVDVYKIIDSMPEGDTLPGGDELLVIEGCLASAFDKRKEWLERVAAKAREILEKIRMYLPTIRAEWDRIAASQLAKSFVSLRTSLISRANEVREETRKIYFEEAELLKKCVWGSESEQMSNVIGDVTGLCLSDYQWTLEWACCFETDVIIETSILQATKFVENKLKEVNLLEQIAHALKKHVVARTGERTYKKYLALKSNEK